MKVWVNGKLHDPEDARVSVWDHGMLVGDGVFETVKAVHGEPFAQVKVWVNGKPPTAKVCVVPWRRNEHGALAGLKTVSYADNVIALAYAKKRGGGEAIFGNLAGDLCEGTGSNVFVVRDGRLITPPLSSGCLAGVTRELVLEWCGGEEENLPLSEFTSVSEAFLTSTTRDVQPIAAIDDVVLPAAPGPVTAKVMQTFAARAAEHSDP